MKELSWHEVLELVNMGDNNSGACNSGNCNSGACNSGNCNSGGRNSGHWNFGDWNSGDWNLGSRNSGHYNSGDWNAGNWNSCSCESGCFNSKNAETIRVFNNHVVDGYAFYTHEGVKICNRFKLIKNTRTKRYFTYKQSWALFWCGLSQKEKQKIQEIPHFDKEVFFEITGIDVDRKRKLP